MPGNKTDELKDRKSCGRHNELLRRVGAVAEERGTRAFLVGGPVRDIMLGAESPDIDIAVEKDSRGFGEALARELSGRFVYHARFLTGTILEWRTANGERRIDLSQTRTEEYARPAVLPKVKPAGIEEDLARRDFSINAMALELAPEAFGRLIDPHRGRADLDRRLVRVLHPASFVDDPTRAFRAIRFAVRLGFEIEPGTLELMRDSIGRGYPGLLTPERILYELRLACAEPKALQVLEATVKEKLLESCFPSSPKSGVPGPAFLSGLLRISRAGATCRNRRRETAPTAPGRRQWTKPELLCLYVLSRLPLTDRFPITRLERDSLQALRTFPGIRARLLQARKSSTVYRLLGRCPAPALELLRCLEPAPVRRRLADFLDNLSRTRIRTTGRDLDALGLEPGPVFRRILDRLLCARLDGTVSSDAEEARLARLLVKRALSRQPANRKSKIENRKSPHV